MMKRLVILIITLVLLTSCAPATKDSGLYEGANSLNGAIEQIDSTMIDLESIVTRLYKGELSSRVDRDPELAGAVSYLWETTYKLEDQISFLEDKIDDLKYGNY
ncbi:MAG: hypothetical protein AAB116_00615 [Candidatus Poribacteria bacterium]